MAKVQVAGVIGALGIGYLWFLLGIAWAPSNKLYQQGLVILLWLPALIAVIFLYKRLFLVWQANRLFLTLLLLLLGWAALSALWTNAEYPLNALKRVLYVGLFLATFALLADARPESVWKGLAIAFVILALSCPLSFYLFYVRDMHPLSARLYGMGQAGHPILGAYVMALAVMWGLQCLPRNGWRRVLWGGLIAMLVLFIAFGQSRGAMLALIIAACSMPLWNGGRVAWLVCLAVLGVSGLGFLLFAPLILERGFSYRPDIFWASMEMIMQNPWLGLGLGAEYRVVTSSYPAGFDHAHNMFTHTAIELGVVGFLLWSGLWLIAFRIAWLARHSREGRMVLGSLLVSFIALQFDAASLWDTPRAEWFVTWLPLGLVVALVVRKSSDRLRVASTVVN